MKLTVELSKKHEIIYSTDFLAVSKGLEVFHVTCPTEAPYLIFKKTYCVSSASSSGTMLPLLTEPRRDIFGVTAGAVIRSSVKINHCQNIDIILSF